MTTKLKARIEKVAQAIPCPVCLGRRQTTIVHTIDGEGQPAGGPDDRATCPVCGQSPALLRIVHEQA